MTAPGTAQETPPGASTAFRCATAARGRGDSAVGTAAPAHRWLLVEHPGPWRVDALQSPGISTADAREIAGVARSVRGRAVLVRRPGRPPAGSLDPRAERRWVAVDVTAGTEVTGTWTERTGLGEAAAAFRDGLDDTRTPTRATPRVLVCTHGVHDACCAVRGRPVAAALARQWPDLVWECSHLGGDRFAATMVTLPDGACYGGLGADTAADVVAGHLGGRVRADYLRGLSAEAAPMQAALVHALRRHGPAPIDSVRAGRLDATGEETWTATLTGTAPMPATMTVRVQRTWDAPAQLTCRAVRESSPLRYEATTLEEVW